MSHQLTERRRVLVFAKTYPELSSKYGETVCTAAVDEAGEPLRLYPIPFRYLDGPQRFRRYQWISLSLRKSQNDVRPESYTVDRETITLGDTVAATSDEWGKRAEIVLKSQVWQHSSIDSLNRAQQEQGRSLAFIRPRAIVDVRAYNRSTKDATTFKEKLISLRRLNSNARRQLDLFENTMPAKMKHLEYIGQRVCVEWLCADDDCRGHSMQVLDWEICELARRQGLDAAIQKVQVLLDSDRYRSAFFLGNFHMYPASFAIIGLWYPTRRQRLF